MNKIIIIYTQFLDSNGEYEKIGGIETYIQNLKNLCLKKNYEVNIIQFADKNFIINYEKNVIVYGVEDKRKVNSKLLLNKAYEIGNIDKDILIFASSHMNIKNNFKKSIAIQHGIYWDLNTIKGKKMNKFLSTIFKSLQIYLEIRRNKLVSKVICVDYNYINWYRSLTILTNERLICIPNFTNIKYNYKFVDNDVIKIIFARRLEEIRGVNIVKKAIEKLEFKDLKFEFTFAGSGKYEGMLKEYFKNNAKVSFITYKSNESIDIHSKYDIAVVPSIGSEGTSLSLLEAMSASCCVICTNVGGMTNIIIDNFNGFIISPNENELYDALLELILNKEKRKNLSKNGYESVSYGFSLEVWNKKWGEVISE